MSTPVVVVHLVRCSQSLLLCDDIPTDALRFADPPACEAALPGLIAEHSGRDSAMPVVMGRCRIMIPSPPYTRHSKPVG